MKQTKRMMAGIIAVGMCTALLAGCGTSEEIDLFRGEPVIEYSAEQTESSVNEQQNVEAWQKGIEEVMNSDPLAMDILTKLKEASGNVDDVNYRAKENVVIFNVKIADDDDEKYEAVFGACTEEIQQLLKMIEESGVPCPAAEIECYYRGNSGRAQTFPLEE